MRELDRVEACFAQISKSIETINHNSTTSAAVLGKIEQYLEKLADIQDKICIGVATHAEVTKVEHGMMTTEIQKTLDKQYKIIVLLICFVGALVGIKLAFPGL